MRISPEVALFTAALVALSIYQLLIGADLWIVLLSVSSVSIGFLPVLVLGRDLYTVIAALFSFRYTGAALLAKTFYGQPLDTFLYNPLKAYLLVNVLIIVEVSIILFARRRDKFRTIFPKLHSLHDLRAIGLIFFVVGSACNALTGLLRPGDVETVGSAGATWVVASSMATLSYFALACEVNHRIMLSGGKEFVSRRLVMMLCVALVFSLFLNIRALFVNSFICVFLVAFLHNAISLRHIVSAGTLFLFFSYVLSPLSLEVRTKQYDASGNLSKVVIETVTRAVTDPEYISVLRERDAERSRYEAAVALTMYNYFGNNSIANRASFVALLDAVAEARIVNPEIGFEAVEQVAERVVPSFLYPDKENFPFGYGDWLAWRLGMFELGRVAYLNFGLPMEGLAVFGLVGFVTYPVLFMLPLLLVCARVTSLRIPTAPSVFLISSLQWTLVEGTSDAFLSLLMRQLPMTILPAYAVYWFWVQKRPLG